MDVEVVERRLLSVALASEEIMLVELLIPAPLALDSLLPLFFESSPASRRSLSADWSQMHSQYDMIHSQ